MTYIVIPLIEQATHRSGQCNRSYLYDILYIMKYYDILYIMTYIVIPLIEQATHRSGQCNRSNIITVLRTGESELFNF